MQSIKPLRSMIADVRTVPHSPSDILYAFIKFSETGDAGQIAWSHQGGGGAIKALSGMVSNLSWDELLTMLNDNKIPDDVALNLGINTARLKLRVRIETN